MAQKDIILRQTITGVAAESTPGTHAGSLTRIALVSGSSIVTNAGRESVDVPSESPIRFGVQSHVLGRTMVEWQATIPLRGLVSGDRLSGSGATTLRSHEILYKHAFGRRYVAQGNAVAGNASTTTAVDLSSATGRKVGEVVMIGQYVRTITAISTNTITVTPALPSGPADAVVVRGARGFYLANQRSATLTLEQKIVDVAGSAEEERRVLGAFGAMTWTFPQNSAIPTMALKGQAISHAGPAALTSPSWSLGVSPADDDMGDPLPCYLSCEIDGTATVIEPASVKIGIAQNTTPIGGSTSSGISGFLDTSGRENGGAVTLEFNVRQDGSYPTAFDAKTVYHVAMLVDPSYGSGTPSTLAAFVFPRFQLTARPIPVDVGGGRGGYTLKGVALPDTLTPASLTTAEDRDMAWAPMRFALI